MRNTKWFMVIMLVLFAAITFVSAQETKIINGYKVTRGERPAIDLSKVPAGAYYPGRISIKLKPEMEKFIKDDVLLIRQKNSSLITGVSSIDALNAKFQAEKMKPHLYGFYEISPASLKNREKHKAWGFHLWIEITLPSDTDVIQAVKEYMALDEVEFAEPYYIDQLYEPVSKSDYIPSVPFETSFDPKLTVNDTRFSEQWHYHNTGQNGGTVDCDIDLPEAWDIERGNNQVIVAVQDMGLQIDHPDLAGNIWSGIGYDFQANNATIEAGDHGCHTGGTISAVTNNNTGVSGIAGGTGSGDGVRLMSVQVYAADGSGGGNTNLPYIYSADNGAAISQNSWGYTSVDYYVQSVLDGIDYFNANGGGDVLDGGLTIFAAGNSNATGNWWPGCYSGAMAVAATTYQDIRASYSNYGDWVEVSAPGGQQSTSTDPKGVLSCISGSTYAFYQGTSMACPHTSGVAALIVSLAPNMFTNTQVRNIIKDTTDPIDALNPTYVGKLGTGRINAYAALMEAQTMMAPPPAPTLTSPPNTGISTSSRPTFDWSDVAGASTYTILVDNNSNFGSPEINQSVSVSNFTPATDLLEGTYYWKVKSVNLVGESGYTTAWSVTLSFPDINLSESLLSNSAAPGTSISDSFNIQNLGSYVLSYTGIGVSYSGFQIPGGNYHTNDFQSGLIYTNSGTATWVTSTGGTWNGNTTCAKTNAAAGINTMTSAAFDGSAAINPIYLDFDHTYSIKTGSSIQVEYFNGSAWVQIYYSTAAVTGHERIELPVKASNMQLRFTGVMQRAQAVTSAWSIDNIVVSSAAVPYSWLTINSATSGTVSVSGSNTINLTCDATGLTEGTYNAEITVISDDPDESSKILPVEFTVETIGAPPAAPSLASPGNASTLYILKPVFDWSDVSGATSYTILVDNNATFASPEINQSPAASTYTPAADLALGTYYWKVLSTNTFGSSSYSGTWSVTIVPLTAPINVTTSVTGSNLTASWDTVSGATSYDVYSATDPYGTYTFVTNVATNSYVTSTAGAKLFWYVKAKN